MTITASSVVEDISGKHVTPIPTVQLLLICLVEMAEALNGETIQSDDIVSANVLTTTFLKHLVLLLFPFLAFMIEDMGYTGEQLGYHAGILAATFCGGQFCTSVPWGMISDKYGRKFAIVLGTLGAGLGMLIFGFSQTFAQGALLTSVSLH